MLELVAYLITDEARTDRHDLRQHLEVVLPKCVARLDDIEDDIAEAQDRRDLDGAVQPDDIDVATDGLVVVARHMRKLRRDPERPLLVIIEILRARHAHATLAEAEVQQLVHIRLVLEEDVRTADADVRRATLDVDLDIRRLHPEVPDALLRIFEGELPVLLEDRRTVEAGLRHHRVGLIAEAALRQCYIDHFKPLPSPMWFPIS